MTSTMTPAGSADISLGESEVSALPGGPTESLTDAMRRMGFEGTTLGRSGRGRSYSLSQRLFSKLTASPEGCWLWTGGTNEKGYGRITQESAPGEKRFVEYTHRAAWLLLTQVPIAESMTLDHLCRQKTCCNPAHLEIVSRSTNSLRALGRVGGQEDCCNQGHQLTEDNVYQNSSSGRLCRECRRLADRRRSKKVAA